MRSGERAVATSLVIYLFNIRYRKQALPVINPPSPPVLVPLVDNCDYITFLHLQLACLLGLKVVHGLHTYRFAYLKEEEVEGEGDRGRKERKEDEEGREL